MYSLRVDSPLPASTEKVISTVISAAIEVHTHLGPGFLESIYEEALIHELGYECGLEVQAQHAIVIPYKGQLIGTHRIDILVERCLILELKTVEHFQPIHIAQVISYLKAMQLRAGLLLNFKAPSMAKGIKRVIYSGEFRMGESTSLQQ